MIYCCMCKTKTETNDTKLVTLKNDKPAEAGTCVVCGTKKFKLVKRLTGGDLVSTINSVTKNFRLPGQKYQGELHFPNYNFLGPGTRLDLRLNSDGTPKRDSIPINRIDEAAYRHDLWYDKFKDTEHRNYADKLMVDEINAIDNPTPKERMMRAAATPILLGKSKLGLGLKKSPQLVWTDTLAEELHKPVRHKFERRKVESPSIDHIWAADLVDMQAFSKFNDGYKYLLMVIDVYSRYGWIRALKDKTANSVATAFKDIFNEGRKPIKLWVDNGKEFYNSEVKKLAELYSTNNEEKSVIVERWNRTIKERMFKYFTANSTYKYVDIIQELVNDYNNTKHSTLGVTPAEASGGFKIKVKPVTTPSEPKFCVGDRVRITKKKGTFEKGYTPNWIEEVFVISEVKRTNPVTYKIKDYNNKPIEGSFYPQELQKTNQDVYRIEKVIRNEGNKSLVKWLGYNDSFNSWVDNSEIINLKQS